MSRFKSDPFTVGPVVLGYVDTAQTSLFKPHIKTARNGDQYETYGCSAFFGEEVRQQMQPIVDHIGRQAFGREWDNQHATIKRGIRFGQEKQTHAAVAPYFCSLTTNYPPQIVDQQHQPIVNVIDPSTGRKPIYDGVVAYINITVTDFNQDGGRGVSIKINGVMKYADGEPLSLGAGQDAASMFGNVPPAPPTGARVPGQGHAQGQPPVGQQAPQGGYQQAPQGGYQQAPQGGYQQAPQGGYQQAPQGQGNVYQHPSQSVGQQAPQGQAHGGYDPQTGRPIPAVNYGQ